MIVTTIAILFCIFCGSAEGFSLDISQKHLYKNDSGRQFSDNVDAEFPVLYADSDWECNDEKNGWIASHNIIDGKLNKVKSKSPAKAHTTFVRKHMCTTCENEVGAAEFSKNRNGDRTKDGKLIYTNTVFYNKRMTYHLQKYNENGKVVEYIQFCQTAKRYTCKRNGNDWECTHDSGNWLAIHANDLEGHYEDSWLGSAIKPHPEFEKNHMCIGCNNVDDAVKFLSGRKPDPTVYLFASKEKMSYYKNTNEEYEFCETAHKYLCSFWGA
jgi:hypothetical protein